MLESGRTVKYKTKRTEGEKKLFGFYLIKCPLLYPCERETA